MSAAVRRAVRHLVTVASNSWQCGQCGTWFTSDTPSQLCDACG